MAHLDPLRQTDGPITFRIVDGQIVATTSEGDIKLDRLLASAEYDRVRDRARIDEEAVARSARRLREKRIDRKRSH